MCDLSSKMIIF